MALNPFHLSLLISLVLIPPIAHSIKHIPSDQRSSPFHFIKDLQGCQKGNSTKGIYKLKHYLQQFGYLKYQNQTHLNNDDFDDALESALKTYQENHHLASSGALDPPTISKMILPRCGFPDIINGVNTMQRTNHQDLPSNSFHTVSHYTFFLGNPKWPNSKSPITYNFAPNTSTNAIALVASAFKKWEPASHFTFQRVKNNESSDLMIGFFGGDHGDGYPFDGPGGVLAHAFAPTDGRMHFDAEENWAIGSFSHTMDLESVALHEIGHLLGLGHSTVQGAVMYPGIGYGEVRELQEDDIQGIRSLYSDNTCNTLHFYSVM